MKATAMTLLGLMLCAPVWAIDMAKLQGIHEGCELRAKRQHIHSPADWFEIGRAVGYITGFSEATTLVHPLPENVEENLDAVCKYIDLHPEIWSLWRNEGLKLVLHTLYGGTK